MASKVDKRKVSSKMKKKDDASEVMNLEKPTKEEIAVAKWIKANVFNKKTKFLSHTVEYFTASRAVDKLLTSPWSQPGKNGEEAIFTSRESIVAYLDVLLRKKFFHRAKKIPVSEQELKARSKKREKKIKEDPAKKDKSEAEDENPKKADEAAESSHAEDGKKAGETTSSKGTTKKEKRKIRLDMHLEQQFVDGNDAYVWIYDPIPYYYWIAGGAVVFAVIALCLFPLWPPVVRKGVYYLSVAAAGFLMFILGLAVVRVLVFCMLWLLSLGRHHLWLFPNLTEDVGFFASFWPLWKYEYKGKDSGSKKKGKGKDKVSDDEEEDSKDEGSDKEEQQGADDGVEDAQDNKSETESEGSQQTGKDFEMVEKEEEQ